MDDDELSAAEAARDRRRDHRAAAHERELMRTGSAKVFKQILDAQEKRARADEAADDEAGDAARDETDVEAGDAARHPDAHRHHGHGHRSDRGRT